MTPSRQPSLADLTARSMAARAASVFPSEDTGDVEPHEVLSGTRVDASAAWDDAQLPLALLGVAVGVKAVPADWASFVEWNPGRLGIPMAAGHFPQRLRDIAGLFAADLADAPAAKAAGFTSLRGWIDRSRAGNDSGLSTMASGLSRELGDVISSERGEAPAELNEQAADLWCRGDRETALAVWESMPVSPVASFNIGMAQLMLGRTQAAQAHLREAVAALPPASAWNHLASLYLTVARLRG